MPTLAIPTQEFCALLEEYGVIADLDDLRIRLPYIGVDVGRLDEVIEIEVFPDRPDLLSAETMIWSLLPFMYGKEPPLLTDPDDSEWVLTVDPALADVRPVALSAVVQGIDLSSDRDQADIRIQHIMDHQEKLHTTLGRQRRKVSIGVHDITALKPPLILRLVDGEFTFPPLGYDTPWSVNKILDEHPKGVSYQHLIANRSKCPLLADSNGTVLAMPPIINGIDTAVHQGTKDVLIDVTGTDHVACRTALHLMILQLSMFGGQARKVTVKACDGSTASWPDAKTMTRYVDHHYLERLIGTTLSEEDVQKALRRMAHNCSIAMEGTYHVEVPAWRTDIMHPIDLVEEVAIGLGYENIPRTLPSIQSIGRASATASLDERIRVSMMGLGCQQVQSLTLSSEDTQFTRMRWKTRGEVTTIVNPSATHHTIMRQRILPSLADLLVANRHNDLPQRVFEHGSTVVDHNNRRSAAWLCAEGTSGFERARGFAQRILADLGLECNDVRVTNEGPWLKGRGAVILIDEQPVIEFGEIDPVVSAILGIEAPMHGGEIDLERIGRIALDPVHQKPILPSHDGDRNLEP